MKTLILNGSYDTKYNSVVEMLENKLTVEYETINLYSGVNSDEIIYQAIQSWGSIILISPVVFGTISGRLIDFAMHFTGSHSSLTEKCSAVIFIDNDVPCPAFETAKKILGAMNVHEIFPDIVNVTNISVMLDWINSKDIFLNEQTESQNSKISKYSSPKDKIDLFRSLFKGREDVYALRWHNTKTKKSGYSPVCSNKWMTGVCNMPKIKCADCHYRNYTRLDDKAVFAHLSGKDTLCRDVIGIYPMLPDETTNFLAFDFDDGEWQKDASAVRGVCNKNSIPCSVERSRSGTGVHLWIFFAFPIPSAKARKLGSGLLTEAMNNRSEIKFSSYDRMFPNQDTMPSGGFGNLIALPLQKQAVLRGNSVFIDENLAPYHDQWAYLSCIEKLTEENVNNLVNSLCGNSELGELYAEEKSEKPRKITLENISESDFPDKLNIVISNMLYIPKTGISQNGLNRIKRLASFKNPDFYKAQAMHMSTYDKPRIISLSDANDNYIMLPRGYRESLEVLLYEYNCTAVYEDKTVTGRTINVEFNGELHSDQKDAVDSLMKYENGVISATTAFGKTVTVIGLIAERKVNTLILVHTQALLQQWKKSLVQFLIINEILPDQPIKQGRKKQISAIGH